MKKTNITPAEAIARVSVLRKVARSVERLEAAQRECSELVDAHDEWEMISLQLGALIGLMERLKQRIG